MITNENEAKTMTQHVLCDCKCKFISTNCHSNQKWDNKTCQSVCKNYRTCKKDYSWNPNTCICENSKHLRSFADTSVYGYCIKKDKYYSNKCYEYCLNKLSK